MRDGNHAKQSHINKTGKYWNHWIYLLFNKYSKAHGHNLKSICSVFFDDWLKLRIQSFLGNSFYRKHFDFLEKDTKLESANVLIKWTPLGNYLIITCFRTVLSVFPISFESLNFVRHATEFRLGRLYPSRNTEQTPFPLCPHYPLLCYPPLPSTPPPHTKQLLLSTAIAPDTVLLSPPFPLPPSQTPFILCNNLC